MIRIIGVGKLKDKALASLVTDFKKRIDGFMKCEIVELKDSPNYEDEARNLKSIQAESDLILKAIRPQEYVIVLDLKGTSLSSEAFSRHIDQCFVKAYSDIAFVIGGSLGVDDRVRQRAQFQWKLSDCTFPHGIVRLLVAEQLYRTFKILSNQTYHK